MESQIQKPWEVLDVIAGSDKNSIHVLGLNHFDNANQFSWHLDRYSFGDLEFAMKRYDFSRAKRNTGSLEIFERLTGGQFVIR